jgi:hypothetical protein
MLRRLKPSRNPALQSGEVKRLAQAAGRTGGVSSAGPAKMPHLLGDLAPCVTLRLVTQYVTTSHRHLMAVSEVLALCCLPEPRCPQQHSGS